MDMPQKPRRIFPQPPHVPTKLMRDTVTLHTLVGTTQVMIASILKITDKTLREHYRDELDFAKAQMLATIGGALFNKAKGGDTSAMIFIMKTQAGWAERTVVDNLSSDMSMSPGRSARDLTDDELAAMLDKP